ncbi:MAG: hypothetical protein ACXABY_23980, partial [Candidatus Thorarchaeota archaeon]
MPIEWDDLTNLLGPKEASAAVKPPAPFVSRLYQTLSKKLGNHATVRAIQKELKWGNFSKEELEWSGMNKFLQEHSKNPNFLVRKEDLLKRLDDTIPYPEYQVGMLKVDVVKADYAVARTNVDRLRTILGMEDLPPADRKMYLDDLEKEVRIAKGAFKQVKKLEKLGYTAPRGEHMRQADILDISDAKGYTEATMVVPNARAKGAHYKEPHWTSTPSYPHQTDNTIVHARSYRNVVTTGGESAHFVQEVQSQYAQDLSQGKKVSELPFPKKAASNVFIQELIQAAKDGKKWFTWTRGEMVAARNKQLGNVNAVTIEKISTPKEPTLYKPIFKDVQGNSLEQAGVHPDEYFLESELQAFQKELPKEWGGLIKRVLRGPGQDIEHQVIKGSVKETSTYKVPEVLYGKKGNITHYNETLKKSANKFLKELGVKARVGEQKIQTITPIEEKKLHSRIYQSEVQPNSEYLRSRANQARADLARGVTEDVWGIHLEGEVSQAITSQLEKGKLKVPLWTIPPATLLASQLGESEAEARFRIRKGWDKALQKRIAGIKWGKLAHEKGTNTKDLVNIQVLNKDGTTNWELTEELTGGEDVIYFKHLMERLYPAYRDRIKAEMKRQGTNTKTSKLFTASGGLEASQIRALEEFSGMDLMGGGAPTNINITAEGTIMFEGAGHPWLYPESLVGAVAALLGATEITRAGDLNDPNYIPGLDDATPASEHATGDYMEKLLDPEFLEKGGVIKGQPSESLIITDEAR